MTRTVGTALALCLTLAIAGYAEAQTRDGKLGSGCGGDEDCMDGLTCVTSDPTAGGVPGGICSAFCASDVDCAPYSESAFCAGLCLERCELDVSSGGEWDLGKCHGRTDMACGGVACADDLCTTPITACLPFCSEDDQCGDGFFCNRARFQCQAVPPEGDAPGAACDPNSLDLTCLGFCDLDIESTVRAQAEGLVVFFGICEDACILGAPDSCADPETPGSERACLGARGIDAWNGWATGTGDLGICLTLCNCTSDCRGDQICLPWDSGGAYDSAGVCQRGHQPRNVADCLPLGSGGATGDTSTGCKYGAVRACKMDGCLGTAECQSDGTYADCHCIDDQEGAGGASDSTKPAPVDDASGCGCRMSGKRSPAVGIILLALFASVLRRVRAPRRR